MLYEVIGAPELVAGGGSQRFALPALGNHGAIRLSAEGHGYFAFGDNTVVADANADSAQLPSGSVEFIVPLAGATHIAVVVGTRMTITPVRVIR